MSERGEYRAIRRVLLDGPDFQKLSERARWIFVVLKINLGPAGIDVVYPDALTVQLSAQSGAGAAQIIAALEELEAAKWIAREANVLWIKGQLANDPHFRQSDDKHRKGIQRHVGGLPRLGIVREYVMTLRSWFTIDGTPIGDPSEGLAWAFKGPSKQKYKEKNKNKEKTSAPASQPAGDELIARTLPAPATRSAPKHPHFAKADCDTLHGVWTAEMGPVEYSRFRKAFARLFPETPLWPIDAVVLAVKECCGVSQAQGGYALRSCTPESFVDRAAYWVEMARKPMHVDGIPTERGKLWGVAA